MSNAVDATGILAEVAMLVLMAGTTLLLGVLLTAGVLLAVTVNGAGVAEASTLTELCIDTDTVGESLLDGGVVTLGETVPATDETTLALTTDTCTNIDTLGDADAVISTLCTSNITGVLEMLAVGIVDCALVMDELTEGMLDMEADGDCDDPVDGVSEAVTLRLALTPFDEV